MEASCAFFEQQLSGGPGSDYLKRRGLAPETIKRFRLGFSPESRTALKLASREAEHSGGARR